MSNANTLDLSTSATKLLHRAGQAATEMFAKEAGDTGLTARQLVLLQAVAATEGASQTRLVEITGIDRSTLADIMRRMLKKGLIQRRRTKEDARAYAVKLTADGREMLRRAAPVGHRVDTRLLEAIPAQRRDGFLRDLERLAALLEQK